MQDYIIMYVTIMYESICKLNRMPDRKKCQCQGQNREGTHRWDFWVTVSFHQTVIIHVLHEYIYIPYYIRFRQLLYKGHLFSATHSGRTCHMPGHDISSPATDPNSPLYQGKDAPLDMHVDGWEFSPKGWFELKLIWNPEMKSMV